MKGIKDWVFSQVVSNSLASSRPLSGSGIFFHEVQDPPDGESSEQGPSPMSNLAVSSVPSESSQGAQPNPVQQRIPGHNSHQPSNPGDEKGTDPLAKVESLQIKFFRLLQRLGQSQENPLVAKVLYRMHLATLIRAGESDLKRVNFRNVRANKTAREQESSGVPELDFSIRILVLGKTGVGKSATINSIFEQPKTETNAFQPATNHIQEVVGTVNGIKIAFIDTPGFLPSTRSNLKRNRKIMLSVKRYIRRSPPDIVLYFERLDLINMDNVDFPLLKLMTEIFGAGIWFNTIFAITHSSPDLPEGPNGYPISYESYVNRCTDLLQHYVHQAVSDTRLENLVLLVENHSRCKKNFMGENVLPNGQVWKLQFLLLCTCMKILVDVNALLDFRDSITLGIAGSAKQPSVPHLLSLLLRHRSVPGSVEAENEVDAIILSHTEKDDEYDQLPPIRILTKFQFEKLTKSQKSAYLDELDYRETLYMKKQLKEECQRRKENKISKEKSSSGDDKSGAEEPGEDPEAVPLPDMAIPPSFDSDFPVHRYRCLVTTDQWLVRPVLDPQGWDHDVGFDGISVDSALEIKRNLFASVSGQMSKDKRDFSLHSECTAAYTDPASASCLVGLDVQSAGRDIMYTVRSNGRLGNLKHNIPECGVSVASFGRNNYLGIKLEDTIFVGKRLKLLMNGARMGGPGPAAYGAGFEATLRGSDYPVHSDSVTLSMTAISFNKETVLSGGIQSDFRPMRGMKLLVNGNVNNRKMGQINVKVNSSEHMGIALIAVFSIIKSVLRRKAAENESTEALKSE